MSPRVPRPIQWLLVAVLYYAAAWLGLRMAVFPETASPVWPATGLAVAALAIVGLRAWPAIAVAVFAVEYPAFGAQGAALLTLGNTLEAVLGAWMLRRLGGAHAFLRRDGIALYLVAALVAPLPSALCALLPLQSLGGPTPMLQLGATWYLGDVMGAALVAPPLVLLASPVGGVDRRRLEWGLFLACALATAIVAFYPWRSGAWTEVRIGFIVIAPLVWAASRFGPPVTAWTSLALTLAALAGLAAGAVPGPTDRNLALLQVQALAGLMAIIGLYLAATVHERNRIIALLEEASRQKTAFLNKAAHELRTPLTPIRLQLHVLQSQAGDANVSRAAMVLGRNVDRMNRIVERLLQAARIDEDVARINRHPMPLDELASKAVSVVGDRVPIAIAAEGNARVDQAAMLRVVAELLANAVRHARSGVHIDAKPLAEGGCRIIVRDDGPGIAQADRDRIFDAFGPSQAGAAESTGLGLYIAKALVVGHKGTLHVDDAPGGGARFTIELPA